MAVDKFKPYVHVISEDDANRQMANGFRLLVDNERQIVSRDISQGWHKIAKNIDSHLSRPNAHLVLLVDFDGHELRPQQIFPDGVPDRVFVLGVLKEPEDLRRETGMTFEQIGRQLARDCRSGKLSDLWEYPLLRHNQPTLQRALATLRPILFSQ